MARLSVLPFVRVCDRCLMCGLCAVYCDAVGVCWCAFVLCHFLCMLVSVFVFDCVYVRCL